MSADEAREFRQAHDKDARQLSRKSKRELERIAAEYRVRIYGQSSKQELTSEILGYQFPAGKLNEAIHVLHHAPGDVWSACAICTGGAA